MMANLKKTLNFQIDLIKALFIVSLVILIIIVEGKFLHFLPCFGSVQDQIDSFQSYQAKTINYNLMSKVCQCRLPPGLKALNGEC